MTTTLARQLTNHLKHIPNFNGLVAQFQRCMAIKCKVPHRLIVQGVDKDKYTHVPIPYPKDGGRGANGKVENRRVSGGAKQNYRLIDTARPTPESENPIVERVLQVRSDPQRSAKIALVARDDVKRWIVCPNGVGTGDLIRSYGHIPKHTVQPVNGDSYRLGALAIGSVIHNVERQPGNGGGVAKAAGTSAVLVRKVDDACVVKMPSGHEMLVSKYCVATYGRVSNIDHNKKHIGSPNRMRWLGIKQRSGKFQRKTGYNGRKMRKTKPIISYHKSVTSTHESFNN